MKNINKAIATLAVSLAASSMPASAAVVIAGWETWADQGADTYIASLTNGATGSAKGTATGGAGWANWNNAGASNGASIDGTWGTLGTPDVVAASTASAAITDGVGLVNETDSGEMTFTIVNTSGTFMDLTGFYFDGGETRQFAAGNWSLSILAGSDVTTANDIANGALPINLGPTTGNFDTDLTAIAGLTDLRLENNETVIFELALTGGGSQSRGGHNAMIDNVAVTAIPEPSHLALLGMAGMAFLVRRRRK